MARLLWLTYVFDICEMLKKKNAKDSNNKLDLFRNMSTLKMEDSTYLPICLREMPSMLSPMVVSFVPDARPAQ